MYTNKKSFLEEIIRLKGEIQKQLKAFDPHPHNKQFFDFISQRIIKSGKAVKFTIDIPSTKAILIIKEDNVYYPILFYADNIFGQKNTEYYNIYITFFGITYKLNCHDIAGVILYTDNNLQEYIYWKTLADRIFTDILPYLSLIYTSKTIIPHTDIYINLHQYIQEYKHSCNKISNKKNILYDEYHNHMKVLQKILGIISVLFSSYALTFHLMDEYVQYEYINLIDHNFTEYIQNNKTSMYVIQRHNIFNFKEPIINDNDVIENTVLNRSIHLTYMQNKLIFNYVTHCHNLLADLEYDKYMSILPKYHYLSDMTTINDNDTNYIDDLQRVLRILDILNSITKEFIADYVITKPNNPIFVQQENNLQTYTNKHDVNKILYVLINNNYMNHQNNYYYFNFDGPDKATSVLNYNAYVNERNTYQPLDITTNDLRQIEENYKGTSPLFSRDLNKALQEFTTDSIPISSSDILTRIKNTMIYKDYTMRDIYDKETIYIFHGTNKPIHKDNEKIVYLASFLSCTFNIYIAIDYAFRNFQTRQLPTAEGVIYVCKVSKNVKYVNLNDGLYQILLLPGAKITIDYEMILWTDLKYIFCTVHNNEDRYYTSRLYNSIIGTSLGGDVADVSHIKSTSAYSVKSKTKKEHLYNVKNLREPYKSYYNDGINTFVEISNEGYCISAEKFKVIHARITQSASSFKGGKKNKKCT